MSYKDVDMYVSSGKYDRKCLYSMTPSYITVHNTANDVGVIYEKQR